MDAEMIAKKIAEYREKRQKFLEQANLQIAAYDGAIEALAGLLNPGPVSNAGNNPIEGEKHDVEE